MASQLWDAISSNNLKEIHQILSTKRIDLNKPYVHDVHETRYRNRRPYEVTYKVKGTYLQKACVSGSPVVACALVKAGANVDTCDTYKGNYYEHNATALILAVMQKKVDLIKKLLHRCGADVNATDNEGFSPLHYEAQSHKDYGSPFKHTASESTEVQKEIAHLLLAAGATVDLQDKKGQTPLQVAAIGKDVVIAQILLQHHASVHISDSEGMTPLHFAAKAHDVDTAKILLQHGAKVDIQNSEGMTPLHFTVDVDTWRYSHDQTYTGDLVTAKILLQHGARVDIRNHKGLTPLHISIHKYHNEMCKLLIQDTGSSSSTVVNLAENDGITPLYAVIKELVQPTYHGGRNLDETVVRLLIEKGADLEAKKDHLTPLHLAADGGLFNVVKLLVEAGADIHAETPNTGLTPLDMAEHGKKLDIIDYLTARQESYREKNKREEPSEEQDEEDDDDDDDDESL